MRSAFQRGSVKRDVVYKNYERYNLMQALNVEDNTEGLRYDKVILATPTSRSRGPARRVRPDL